MRCPKTHKAISGILDLSGEVVGRHTGKYIYQQEEWVLQEFLKCGLAQQNSINDGYGHSYKTGKGRDWLCHDCNRKIGDDPEELIRLSEYLKAWEKKHNESL